MLTLVFTWFGDLARKLLHSRREVLRVHPHQTEVRIVCNWVCSMVPVEGEIYWKTSESTMPRVGSPDCLPPGDFIRANAKDFRFDRTCRPDPDGGSGKGRCG